MKNELKAISQTETEVRVGNYMVLFGGKDLTGEFFTKSTNFNSNYTDLGVLYVDFEHGRDAEKAGNNQNNVLGLADWKSARVDETGIFVERVLNRRAKYMEYLMQLINAGVMGTSSEAIPGAPLKKSSGEIVEWPLMRDSLTVTPMEPRMLTENVLTAAKALVGIFPNSKSLAQIAGLPPAASSVKTIEAIASLSDVEDYLRDAGMSRTEAKALLSRVKSLGQRDADEGAMQQLLEAIQARGKALAA